MVEGKEGKENSLQNINEGKIFKRGSIRSVSF